MGKLKKAIIIVLIVLIVGGGVAFGYFYMKTQYEIQIAEAESELADYINVYGALGEIWEGYTVEWDQPYGKLITAEDLIFVEVPDTCVDNVITDIDELVGKYYRVNVTAGTLLTTDVVMDFPLEHDERAYDVITTYNPIGLEANDFVDIRINMPMGEDYIALSHKRVDGVYGGVLKLIMSEYDIAVYNSLIVDSVLFQGAVIYATKYVEPGGQETAESFYPISLSVLEMAMKDPNIAQDLDYNAMIQKRLELEEAMLLIEENDLLKALLESGKSIIPNRIQSGQTIYQQEQEIAAQRRLEEQMLAEQQAAQAAAQAQGG